jgi:hypothetical protein
MTTVPNAVSCELIAWHYTIGLRAQQIRESGFLMPATANVPEGEIPVVWFSTRQYWEPTANKAMMKDGQRVSLTFAETIEKGGGGYRFGLPAARLVPWTRLKDEARISREMAAGLIRAGKRAGADPEFWYGALEPVPVSNCAIERLEGNFWVKVED